MPRLFTMGVLVTRFQQRANMVGDSSIAPAEWKAMGSEVYGEVYEEVCDSGLRYFEYELSVDTTGVNYIAEPPSQLALVDNLEIMLDATSGRVRRLRLVQAQERAALAGRTGDPRFYEMVDDRLYLYPTPPANTTVVLRYIPQAPDLSGYDDSEAVDVVTAAGEAMLIWGVAAIARHKDDRFVDYAETQKEKARLRLQAWARNRAFNEQPRRVVDDDFDIDDADWWEAYA